jgi:GYF domain 2
MHFEVFFIYHNGEQRGPYTAKQINHLHKCRFIDDDTLYWREGLDQWQPISQIVLQRRRRNRVLIWSVTLGVVAALALFVSLFGTVTADAWRELTSGDFTAESAWWRARGLVREHSEKKGAVRFDPFQDAQVTLEPPDGATVLLSGTVTRADGATEPVRWRVQLRHDADRAMWTAAPKKADAPPKQ